jgi:mxaJ protein
VRQESPPSALVQAVHTGEVDLAAAWGPLAGYNAKRASPAPAATK